MIPDSHFAAPWELYEPVLAIVAILTKHGYDQMHLEVKPTGIEVTVGVKPLLVTLKISSVPVHEKISASPA